MIKHLKRKLPQLLATSFILVNVAGCSVVDNFVDTKNTKLNYQNNKSVKSLDFPPDLTAPEFDMAFVLPADGVASAVAMRGQANGYTVDGRQINVLPKSTNIRFGGAGATRWLDVDASAESVWPKLRDFWRSVGISVKRDEPRIGIMETEWAENRAGLPMDWLRKAVGKVFQSAYDAGTRDRYRMRIEKPSAQSTRIFLTHKGAEKMITDTLTGWELRPANHELEAEILNKLKAFLQGDVVGAAKRSASAGNANQVSSLASLVEQDGQPILQIHDNYKRAWILTGIMMDRMGLIAEKRNQASGIYEVEYRGNDEDTAKRGFFKRLFGGRKTLLVKGENYQVHVQDAGKLSIVRITDDEGKPLSKRLTQLVLARLKQEFDR